MNNPTRSYLAANAALLLVAFGIPFIFPPTSPGKPKEKPMMPIKRFHNNHENKVLEKTPQFLQVFFPPPDNQWGRQPEIFPLRFKEEQVVNIQVIALVAEQPTVITNGNNR